MKLIKEYIFIFIGLIATYIVVVKVGELASTLLGFPLLDDTDKQNFVNIAILVGALFAIRESIKLRKNELEPVIHLNVENCSTATDPDRFRNPHLINWCSVYFGNSYKDTGKYICLKNTGKGNAFNLKVSILDSESKPGNLSILEYSNNTIPANGEVYIKINKDFKTVGELDDLQFKIEVETIEKEKTFFVYYIRNANYNSVELLKHTKTENDIGW